MIFYYNFHIKSYPVNFNGLLSINYLTYSSVTNLRRSYHIINNLIYLMFNNDFSYDFYQFFLNSTSQHFSFTILFTLEKYLK